MSYRKIFFVLFLVFSLSFQGCKILSGGNATDEDGVTDGDVTSDLLQPGQDPLNGENAANIGLLDELTLDFSVTKAIKLAEVEAGSVGGVIVISDKSSLLYGSTITIKAGTLTETTTITVYQVTNISPKIGLFEPLSATLRIEASNGKEPNNFIEITMPFSTVIMGDFDESAEDIEIYQDYSGGGYAEYSTSSDYIGIISKSEGDSDYDAYYSSGGILSFSITKWGSYQFGKTGFDYDVSSLKISSNCIPENYFSSIDTSKITAFSNTYVSNPDEYSPENEWWTFGFRLNRNDNKDNSWFPLGISYVSVSDYFAYELYHGDDKPTYSEASELISPRDQKTYSGYFYIEPGMYYEGDNFYDFDEWTEKFSSLPSSENLFYELVVIIWGDTQCNDNMSSIESNCTLNSDVKKNVNLVSYSGNYSIWYNKILKPIINECSTTNEETGYTLDKSCVINYMPDLRDDLFWDYYMLYTVNTAETSEKFEYDLDNIDFKIKRDFSIESDLPDSLVFALTYSGSDDYESNFKRKISRPKYSIVGVYSDGGYFEDMDQIETEIKQSFTLPCTYTIEGTLTRK